MLAARNRGPRTGHALTRGRHLQRSRMRDQLPLLPSHGPRQPGRSHQTRLADPFGQEAEGRVTKHLVQFSTGAASAEVAWRVVAEHGSDDVVLLTADTLVEDADNWRFAEEIVAC